MIDSWVYTKDDFDETIRKFEKAIWSLQNTDKDLSIIKRELIQVKELSELFNDSLYHTPRISIQTEWDFEKEQDISGFFEEMKKLIEIWKDSIAHRDGLEVERDFWDLYEWFQYADEDSIYLIVLQNFKKLPIEVQMSYIQLPKRYSFLKGKIDVESQDFSLIKEYINMMKVHLDDYKWLFEHLADYRSKKILNGIVNYWFTFDIAHLHSMVETVYSDYYDLDITGQGSNDTVMVDLGAYTGDSVCNFVNTYGIYKKIYAYELTPSTYRNLVNNTADFKNILCIQKGVGSKQSFVNINDDENAAGNSISRIGNTQVELTTLDMDIVDKISMIKMDIEGAEIDALIGAKGHIINEKPQLLVCAYHRSGDIFDIPRLIHSFRDDYSFYLRFNGHGCLWPCDYVIFAV